MSEDKNQPGQPELPPETVKLLSDLGVSYPTAAQTDQISSVIGPSPAVLSYLENSKHRMSSGGASGVFLSPGVTGIFAGGPTAGECGGVSISHYEGDAVSSCADRNQRRIVCAAMKYGTIVIPSVRHWDHITHAIVRALSEEHTDFPREATVQGFLDNRGEFLDRKAAWKVAYEAGQIRHHVPNEENMGLNSENLY